MSNVIYEGSIVDSLAKQIDEKDRRIKELEAERDRLEERLGDWQRETALAKADRDKLREALQRIEKNCISYSVASVARQALKDQT